MPAIFSDTAQATYAGAFFTSAGSGVKFGGDDLHLVQSLSTSMQQPITPLYEIGSNNRYYVVGKSSGNFTIAQILGFRSAGGGKDVFEQIKDMADPCKPKDLTLIYPSSNCDSAGSKSGTPLEINLTGVLVQSVQITQQAQDNLVTANVTGMFTNLTYGGK
jgi:hypothetical protein